MESWLAQEVKALYEEGDLPVEEVSRELGLEVETVRNVLGQVSRKYILSITSAERSSGGELVVANGEGSKTSAQHGREQISDSEDDLIVESLKQLGFSGEDERVRLQALIYLHNEKKGRNDKKEESRGVNVNVVTLNGAIREARKLLGEKRAYEELIDV